MALFNIFPTPIGVFEYPVPITDQVVDAIRAQDTRPFITNTGTQNTQILTTLPELRPLNEWINQQLNQYFDDVYKPATNVKPVITQSWATITTTGQGHHMHTHLNSLISGVFYVKAKDQLVFDKNDGYGFWEIVPREWNEYNSPNINVPVQTGVLLLFPSKLLHHVPPSHIEGERIAIAFNSFVKGEIGAPERLSTVVLA